MEPARNISVRRNQQRHSPDLGCCKSEAVSSHSPRLCTQHISTIHSCMYWEFNPCIYLGSPPWIPYTHPSICEEWENDMMTWMICLPTAATCIHRDAWHHSWGKLCCEQGAHDERSQRESGHHGLEQSPAEQRIPGSQHPAARHPRPRGLPAQAPGSPLRGLYLRSYPHRCAAYPACRACAAVHDPLVINCSSMSVDSAAYALTMPVHSGVWP